MVFCKENEIIYEVTALYSSQSNDVDEWKNQILLDMINAIIISSSVPLNLWKKALLSACYILNKIFPRDREDILWTLEIIST